MNSGCFPSGLFMLDRLSHLKGGVPVGGGGLLPAWHYINYIVYFSIQCGDPLRFARPPFRRDSPSGFYFTSTLTSSWCFTLGKAQASLALLSLNQHLLSANDVDTPLQAVHTLTLEVVYSLCALCLLCALCETDSGRLVEVEADALHTSRWIIN